MAWHRAGGKPLSEPMTTDAFMRHSASMSLGIATAISLLDKIYYYGLL